MKLAIAGSGGRMGRTLIECILDAADLELGVALEAAGSPLIGKDAGELVGKPCGIRVTADYAAAIAGADCLIDFTRPEGTLAHLAHCVKAGVPMVIGTTGLSSEQKTHIADAAKRIAIMFAPPPRLSTTTGCSHISLNFRATRRAIMSPAPPGLPGTTRRIGRVG